jgi:hypothetical protein
MFGNSSGSPLARKHKTDSARADYPSLPDQGGCLSPNAAPDPNLNIADCTLGER